MHEYFESRDTRRWRSGGMFTGIASIETIRAAQPECRIVTALYPQCAPTSRTTWSLENLRKMSNAGMNDLNAFLCARLLR